MSGGDLCLIGPCCSLKLISSRVSGRTSAACATEVKPGMQATLGARDLHVSTKFGRLSAKDATKAGVADAIATRLLTNMADLVGNITDEPASEKQPQRSDILAWLFQG